MKYLIFSTLIAAQLWLAGFEARLNEQIGAHYSDSYHYAAPVELKFGAAVPILPQVEPSLVATESAALVDSIASYLPNPIPPTVR